VTGAEVEPTKPRRYLVCDSDALIKWFLVDPQMSGFSFLQENYGLHAVIPSEIETELRWIHGRYGNRFELLLNKSLSRHSLTVVDMSFIETTSQITSELARPIYDNIQRSGKHLALHVGKGEAYCYAWALQLNLFVMSDDISAFNTLKHNGFDVPSPLLGFFDLYVLLYQAGHFKLRDCEGARRTLMNNSEHLPNQFANASFQNGVAAFSPRIIDPTKPRVGPSQGRADCIKLSPL